MPENVKCEKNVPANVNENATENVHPLKSPLKSWCFNLKPIKIIETRQQNLGKSNVSLAKALKSLVTNWNLIRIQLETNCLLFKIEK